MARKPASRRTVGVDTGGTFTDLVELSASGERCAKLPSVPSAPGRAVVEGLARLADSAGAAGGDVHVVHGTTVALNALLTGAVARTALVTNQGFRDLIEIGRQERPALYALHPTRPAPLVPRERRFEVAQRTWPDERGALVEVERPSDAELAALAKKIGVSGAESVAVCLLHSYGDPAAERRVGAALTGLGLPVTLSSAVLPEHREHERFSTAIVNAALVPRMRAYLAGLEAELGGARLELLQSNGGTLPAERAALEPVRVVFSGPAGGVVGAARAAREAGFDEIVALDMGGTSTDVAYHVAGRSADDGAGGLADAVTHAVVAGQPIAVPALDIHTIGCGGGSLVRVDAGGVLHVGPESAGADPGPVAYGRGDEPTVTDAHVLLGHVAEGSFVAGELALDVERVRRAFERLAERLGTRPEDAARGVLDVARAAMRRALSVMTMKRGKDPRRLPLVAFGGAGGLHAAALAESLEMPGALVPARPGVLSAWGMATADALRDHVLTVLEPLAAWDARRRAAAYAELAALGRAELVDAGHGPRAIEHERVLDLRYRGQSYELSLAEPGAPARRPRRAKAASARARRTVNGADDVARRFHERHAALYGYRIDERELELVGLRVRSIARRPVADDDAPAAAPRARAAPAAATLGTRRAWFDRAHATPIVARDALRPGHRLAGPALVEEFSGTTLVPPRWTARVTPGGHLWLTRD